jgi:hypothetical protein
MKQFLARALLAAVVLVLAGSRVSADMASATTAYAELLQRYVTPRGIRYVAWRESGADLKSLSEVVMLYRTTDPKPLTPNEREALYINLYNAKILETVLFGNVKVSIKELSKTLRPMEVFDRAAMVFDGRAMSLNVLEKRLRDEFKDPRALFALNRGSKSSPQLRPEPYDGATLDAQLDEAARTFLASNDAIEVIREGGKVRIVATKTFEYFANDFKASGGPPAFIQKFGPKDAADAIAGGKVRLEFANYDWDLNAAR